LRIILNKYAGNVDANQSHYQQGCYMLSPRISLYAMAISVMLPSAALASDDYAYTLDADGNDSRIITVMGATDGYHITTSKAAMKTDTPLIDVPQTITVVSRDQLDDQAQQSLADVLRYIPGASVGQGEGNRDQITLRGQNTTADFFIDGVRDDVQYYRGLYNLERIEILKGPTALAFGRGGGGGVINRVQKTPVFGEQTIAGHASINSFGAFDLSADINAPLGKGAAFRVNANYEALDGHRDFYNGERYAVNPYLAVNLGAAWKAGLSYEYVNDDRVVDRGIPSFNGAPLDAARDQFFGVPGVNRANLEAHIAKLQMDGKITSNLKFNGQLLYGDYDKFYANVFANGAASAPNGPVALSSYEDPTTRQNIIGQANLIWNVSAEGIDHKIVVGIEAGDQQSANQRRGGVLSSATLNLANPVFPNVTFSNLSRNTNSDVNTLSVYTQDQIGFGDAFEIVLGLRYDRFKINGVDIADGNRAFARTDAKFSPRIGLIVKPKDNVSVYTSYSNSFEPRSGNQFLTLSPTTQNLSPEKFTNYEAGVKWDVRSDLSLTLAGYQLDRTNATTPDPMNPANSINIGETRVKGIELGVTGRIAPNWQISGGYAYTDAKLRGNDSVRLAQTPQHQISLWNRYDFTPKFGAGVGIIYQSSQFAANRTTANTTRLPGFTRADAALFYNVSDRLKIQLNVENVFDAEYYSDAHNNNNISTGAPVNGRLSVSLKF
jgi:catecholate siderophore receptor